ncbi:Hypothetical predicted protein [Octopus vulgaris]|uniref:Uncharacterized protein n=1 Tax=Octopus vulgaris TaxID=6645 RepID=A0AA36BWV1_OCTVU|nr:Hypothetical predicted protein [Octopus vulgaris]
MMATNTIQLWSSQMFQQFHIRCKDFSALTNYLQHWKDNFSKDQMTALEIEDIKDSITIKTGIILRKNRSTSEEATISFCKTFRDFPLIKEKSLFDENVKKLNCDQQAALQIIKEAIHNSKADIHSHKILSAKTLLIVQVDQEYTVVHDFIDLISSAFNRNVIHECITESEKFLKIVLAPKNIDVRLFNAEILKFFPGDEKALFIHDQCLH